MISLAELVFGSGDYANRIGGAWGFGSTSQLAQPEQWIGLQDREVANGDANSESFFESMLASGTDPTRANYSDYPGTQQNVLANPKDHVPQEILPGKRIEPAWDDQVVTREDPRPNGVGGRTTEYLVTTNGAGIRR